MGNYNKVIIQPDSVRQESLHRTTTELDISKRDNIRPYTFGMGKQAEEKTDKKCSVQSETEGLKVQDPEQAELQTRRNQKDFQKKP